MTSKEMINAPIVQPVPAIAPIHPSQAGKPTLSATVNPYSRIDSPNKAYAVKAVVQSSVKTAFFSVNKASHPGAAVSTQRSASVLKAKPWMLK